MRTVVILIDGREVDSACEDWRHECEARAIAALPGLDERREHLLAVQRRRGKPAADRLRITLEQIWRARR